VSARAWLAFAAMCVIWGIPYLFIKVAVDHGVPPASVAFGRSALGAAVLFPLVLRAGTLRLLKGQWLWVWAYALAEIAFPFLLIPVGERRIASSLSAIVIATTPLLVALLTLWLDPAERPTRTRLVGLLIGFLGVVVFMGVDVAGRPGELLGAVATLFAAAGYAIGPMVLKLRLPDADPRAIMAASLGIAALVLAPLAALDPPHGVPDWSALGSIAVLGVVCSAAGFVIFVSLVSMVGPGRSVVVTYVNPVVAVSLGVLLLAERPGRGAIAGLVLILTGSWLSTHGRLAALGLARSRKRRREGRLAEPSAARAAREHEDRHRAAARK
jgi:drug/metabolite transporter (DMT)-like permease